MNTPTDNDVVAIVTGAGDNRRWFFKLSHGDPYAEASPLTFNEAVDKVSTFAKRLGVDGFVETVADRTWYPVVTDASQAQSMSIAAIPATLPVWQTSKRARRKAARKAAKATARV